MDKHTTDKLTDVLREVHNTDDLQQYMDKLEDTPAYGSFQEYFNSLPQMETIGKAELIRRTNIERSYGYQLLKGTRSPGRDKILLFCLAAGLDLHRTQRALKAGQESILYPRSRRDSIIIFAINEKLNLSDTQELLEQFDEALLVSVKDSD